MRSIAAALIEARRQAADAPAATLDELTERLKKLGKGGEPPAVPHVEEISVGQLNIVDTDGSVRIRLINGAKAPDHVTEFSKPPRAGIVFYDTDGKEHGGLTYSGATVNGEKHAVHELMYRPSEGPDAVKLFYREDGKHVVAGVSVEGGSRIFVGKEDGVSKVELSDKAGQPRLRLVVDDGPPRVEFLDETGKVTKTISA